MTDKPTDAELKAMWQLHAADIGGIFHYARAVLAKWGQPPAGAGEVAEHYRNAIASACEGWTMPDGLRKHLEAALWNPPTPPAQAADSVREDAAQWFTVVYHGISTADEARSLGEHPKAAAISWSHAIRERDAARAAQKEGEKP